MAAPRFTTELHDFSGRPPSPQLSVLTLQLIDETSEEGVVCQIIRSEEDGELTLLLDGSTAEMPLDVMERFIDEARDRLRLLKG